MVGGCMGINIFINVFAFILCKYLCIIVEINVKPKSEVPKHT